MRGKKVKAWQVRWTKGGELVEPFLVSEEVEVGAGGVIRPSWGEPWASWADAAVSRWHPTKRAAARAYLARRQAQVDEHRQLLREAQALARRVGGG